MTSSSPSTKKRRVRGFKTAGKYKVRSGAFYPSHSEKYTGQGNPVFKSQLEYRMMRYLDRTPQVLSWEYEPYAIKYTMKESPRTHKYYIDFTAIIKVNESITKKVLIEVKSSRELQEPKKTKRKSRNTYELEVKTWVKNQAKWNAARKFAKNHAMEFIIITEDQLR